MIRTARPVAALLLIAAALAAMAAVLMPTPASAAVATSKVETKLVVVALGPGTEADPATRDAILTTADQVCEGLTAGVPVPTIERTVAALNGLDADTATRFVAVAAVRCAG